MKIGYCRVSTSEQNLDLQERALRAAGVERVFSDKMSGTSRERQGLDDLLAFACGGDCVVVWRLDRLARSLKDLIEITARVPLGSIPDAELDAEINAETNEQDSERDRDRVQRSHHPQPDRSGENEPDNQIHEDGEDKTCLLQCEPQHEDDKKQRHHAVQGRAVGDGGKFLVRQRDRSGEPHPHALFGREPKPRRRAAYDRRCLASRLQIAEIQDRLDVHEVTKLRGLCRPSADERAPREGSGLAVRLGFQGISDLGTDPQSQSG